MSKNDFHILELKKKLKNKIKNKIKKSVPECENRFWTFLEFP
jgi:hypothetical protein